MPAKGLEKTVTETTAPAYESAPPPGAIPVEKLLTGLRAELLKDEYVLWQGRGSGRAFGALNRALLLRLGLLIVGAALLAVLMLDNRNPSFNWLAWLLGAVLAARIALYFWISSAAPSRQVAMLTTQRLLSLDEMRPESSWVVVRGGESRAEAHHLPPHPIIVTGTKQRGHIRLNRSTGRVRAYSPFILFNAENPVQLAERIKKTLKIDQPIEDRTR